MAGDRVSFRLSIAELTVKDGRTTGHVSMSVTENGRTTTLERQIDTGPVLTTVQRRGLAELCAASDEAIRCHMSAGGWTRTHYLCGAPEERSARNMRSLLALGLAEGSKPPGAGQTQWSWRITDAGRRALAHHTGQTDDR